MEGSEEGDYIGEDESKMEERTTESNAENDFSRLTDEESFIRENSPREEEMLSGEGGEGMEMTELTPDDQIYLFDVSEAEGEFEYPGEHVPVVLEGNFEEDETNTAPPKLIRASPSWTSQMSNDRSKASLRVKIQEQPDRLKVVRMEPKPCIKSRMRKWLNRDHNLPLTESFLGRPYSERSRGLDRVDDPCHHIFMKRFSRPEIQDNSEIGQNESNMSGRRPICGCQGKTEMINKQQTKVPIKEHLQRPILDSSSGGTSEGISKRTKCTCGESEEECFNMSPQLKQNASESYREIELSAHESSNDQCRKPEQCTCDKEDAGGEEQDDGVEVCKKLHELIDLWFELKKRICHCKKTGWMTSRVWGIRNKNKCICKKIKKKRAKLLRRMKEVQDDVMDKNLDTDERMITEEKINELYKMTGPVVAAEFKALSELHRPRPKKESDSFTRMIMKEFGRQLRHYRMQHIQDGSLYRDHKKGDYDSLQYVELPNGSKYYGQFSRLGMEGKCIYKMVHGPIYVGSMVDGKMEGHGKLIYPNGGVVEGTWVNGSLYDPKYTFSDGLMFRPYNWKYCRMPDRRFVSEIVNGMNSPDNVQLSADHPARQIPKGCLDAGEGFYDPQKRVIIHPSTGKTLRIVGEQEGNWIVQNCRREWFEEVPFSRYMYENWYAGTVFPPPGDEPEWFDKEFAKVLLPYTNIADVVQARRLAMDAASAVPTAPGGPGFADPYILPTMTLK